MPLSDMILLYRSWLTGKKCRARVTPTHGRMSSAACVSRRYCSHLTVLRAARPMVFDPESFIAVTMRVQPRCQAKAGVVAGRFLAGASKLCRAVAS
jgi:hypothetical protein